MNKPSILFIAPLLLTGCHQLIGVVPDEGCTQLAVGPRYYQLSTHDVTLPTQVTVYYDPQGADNCAGTRPTKVKHLMVYTESLTAPLATIELVQKGQQWQGVWTLQPHELNLSPGRHELSLKVKYFWYSDSDIPDQAPLKNYHEVLPQQPADALLNVSVP